MAVLRRARGEFQREIAPTFFSHPHGYDDPPHAYLPGDSSRFRKIERLVWKADERPAVLRNAAPQTVPTDPSRPAVLVERVEIASDESIDEIRDRQPKSIRYRHAPRLSSDLTLAWASVPE
jgi:hypothetical protein